MGRLKIHASKSDLMNIDITYAGKRYRFNLFEELQISEAQINKELKDQTSSYSFLTMLNEHLLKSKKELELEKKATYARMYVNFKENFILNGRAASDDACKAKVECSTKFKSVCTELIQTEFNLGIISRAVEAFEQRKDLLQSLSANMRKER